MIVCAASNNAGKLKELRRILERMGHEVKSLRELGIDLDPEETGTTFAENARIIHINSRILVTLCRKSYTHGL